MLSDDLTAAIGAKPDPGVGFRQGVVMAWDAATGENTIDVGGSQLTNLPSLSTGAPTPTEGDVVGLLTWKSAWFVLGRITGEAGEPEPVVSQRIATTVVTADNATTAEETVATVVADLVSGRTYRITFDFGFQPAADVDQAFVRIREDSLAGTEIQLRRLVGGATATFIGANIETEYTASSTGNKTFVATLARSPAGTVTLNASPARPCFLYVDHVRG